MTDTSLHTFLCILAFTAVVLGGIGSILGGLSVVMHAIARRTKTTVDDSIAPDIDAGRAKLNELIAFLRGLTIPTSSSGDAAPASSTTTSAAITSPQTPSVKAAQAGSVRTLILVALAALGI